MSGMVDALPRYLNHGSPQTAYQDPQRFSAGVGSMPPYSHFQHQLPAGLSNYQMTQAQYTGSYQDSAAMPTTYGQVQAAQRSFSAGPSPMQASFSNNPYYPSSPQNLMYYSEPASQISSLNPPSMYPHGLGQYGVEMSNRMPHRAYPPGSHQSTQQLVPNMLGKWHSFQVCLFLTNVIQVLLVERVPIPARAAYLQHHEVLHASQSNRVMRYGWETCHRGL